MRCKITKYLIFKFVKMDIKQYSKLNRLHLGKGLHGLRLLNGYSLEDLAFYIGKDAAYLSRIENTKLSPKMETVSEILAFYEMTLKEFYDKLDDFI